MDLGNIGYYLPSDILLEIFKSLNFEQLITSKYVSKSWNQCINNNPRLFWYNNPIKFYRNLFRCGCVEEEIIDIFWRWREDSIITKRERYGFVTIRD